MAVTDLLKNGLADITGTVEKAVIRICDESLSDDLQKKEGVKTKTSSNVSAGFGGLDGIANNAINDAQNAASNAASSAVKDMAGEYADLAGLKAGSMLKDYTIDYNREFTVQFNPSTMQISSRKYSETDLLKGDASQANNDINRPSPYPDMVFSVTLLFERVVAEEAFMSDTVLKSLTTAGKAVVKSAFDAITGGFESVQNMVEGFVGAIRNDRTHRICFAWNNMQYEGILNGVRTKYTMFDLYGRPIRGEVTLSIRLSDMQVNDINMGYWQEAYDKAFGFDPITEGFYGTARNMYNSISNAAAAVTNAAATVATMASQGAGLIGEVYDVYDSLFGEDTGQKQEEEFIEIESNKKKKDDEAHESQVKENERRAKRERSFISGQTNDRSVSISEERRGEERKTDEELGFIDRNGNANAQNNTGAYISDSGNTVEEFEENADDIDQMNTDAEMNVADDKQENIDSEENRSVNELIGEQTESIPMRETDNTLTGEYGLIDM